MIDPPSKFLKESFSHSHVIDILLPHSRGGMVEELSSQQWTSKEGAKQHRPKPEMDIQTTEARAS